MPKRRTRSACEYYAMFLCSYICVATHHWACSMECRKLGMPGDDNEVTVNLTVGKEVFWSIAEASRA